ncbi:MAG: hypothetical protein H0W99_06955 [Acidobacteria bacterium]|nr:hypothetical protein [Acidobacteriota bacterium]
MKHDRDILAIKGDAFVATLIAFLTVLAAPLMAQRDRDRVNTNNDSMGLLTPAERLEARRARQGTLPLDQEMQLRGVQTNNGKEASNNLSHRAIVAQVEQDFDRIQVVNDEIKRAATANAGFNYKNLTEMTAEIRKRAKRLKGVLNLPPPDESEANQKKLDQITHEEMKAALLVLHDRIMSFVNNPLFQTPNWMDIKLGAKASRDLETVIELSGTIRKNAERLNKPTP